MAPYKWYDKVASLGYPMGPLHEPVPFFKARTGAKLHTSKSCSRLRRSPALEVELKLENIQSRQLCSSCGNAFFGPSLDYARACLDASQHGALMQEWDALADKPPAWEGLIDILHVIDELSTTSRQFDGILADTLSPVMTHGKQLVENLRVKWANDISRQARRFSARSVAALCGSSIAPAPTSDLTGLGPDWYDTYKRVFADWHTSLAHTGEFNMALNAALDLLTKRNSQNNSPVTSRELTIVEQVTQGWRQLAENYLTKAASQPAQVVVAATGLRLTSWKLVAEMCGYGAQRIDFTRELAVMVVPSAMIAWAGGEPQIERSLRGALFPLGDALASDSQQVWSTMFALCEHEHGTANSWSNYQAQTTLPVSVAGFQNALANARAVLA